MSKSNNSKGEYPKKINEKTSKQGKMNPKRPFDKIVKYVEDVSSDSERDLEENSFLEADNVISSARDEVRESNLNIFKAILKNKGVLSIGKSSQPMSILLSWLPASLIRCMRCRGQKSWLSMKEVHGISTQTLNPAAGSQESSAQILNH